MRERSANKPRLAIWSSDFSFNTEREARHLMTQRPDITLEFEETVVLKQGGKLVREFCPQCSETVDMLSPDVLSLVSGISEREIFRLVETGTIYFVEAGRIVACLSCLHRKAGTATALTENLGSFRNVVATDND